MKNLKWHLLLLLFKSQLSKKFNKKKVELINLISWLALNQQCRLSLINAIIMKPKSEIKSNLIGSRFFLGSPFQLLAQNNEQYIGCYLFLFLFMWVFIILLFSQVNNLTTHSPITISVIMFYIFDIFIDFELRITSKGRNWS